MSNEDVKAKLSAIQSDLAAIQRENAAYQAEVNLMTGAVGAATGTLVATSNHISTSLDQDTARLLNAHETALATYELQGQIGEIYERLKRMELANKRIRELQNTRFYDFKTYRQVRKIVQGVMDNLDFNMVSDSLLEKAIEKSHLQTPDYWLTCVLMAVVAWSDNDRTRAERAMNSAMELDKKKTAAFLLIFNLRMRRDAAAVKWFESLKGMELVGADRSTILLFFSLLSRTIKETVSEPTRESIKTYVDELIKESMVQAGVSEAEAVTKVETLMVNMCAEPAFEYPLLTKHCPSWASLWTPLVMARNNERLINYFAGIMEVGDSRTNEFLKVYIDEVVAAPCAAEQGVYDEIERNEAIIRHQGDADAAAAADEARKASEVTRLDIVDQMLRWVYDPSGALEANAQMRLNMLTLLKGLQLKATDQYIGHYRSAFISKLDVAIDDFTVPADLENMTEAKQAAQVHCDGKRVEEQSSVKDTPAYVIIGAGALVGIAGVFLQTWLLLVVTVAAVIAGVGYIYYNRSEREKIRLKWDGVARNMQSTLDDISSEFGDYSREYSERDMLADRLVAQLDAL